MRSYLDSHVGPPLLAPLSMNNICPAANIYTYGEKGPIVTRLPPVVSPQILCEEIHIETSLHANTLKENKLVH